MFYLPSNSSHFPNTFANNVANLFCNNFGKLQNLQVPLNTHKHDREVHKNLKVLLGIEKKMSIHIKCFLFFFLLVRRLEWSSCLAGGLPSRRPQNHLPRRPESARGPSSGGVVRSGPSAPQQSSTCS